MSDLHRLAELLKARNAIDNDIAALVGRPVHKGHVGEYIAAAIFNIKLHESAAYKGSDGYFIDGPLEKRSVNVKFYGKHEGVIDIKPDALPDYYLVLTGPKPGGIPSHKSITPWVIEFAFLFEANDLVKALQARDVTIGNPTSVIQKLWQEAEIYPAQKNSNLVLSGEQRTLLRLFQQELATSAALSS